MSNQEEEIKVEFKKACNDIKKYTNLDNNTLLYLYGLFKQSNEGNCNTTKPNFFDPKGQAKWTAWNDNKDMDKLTAMKRYVRKVKSIIGE